MGGGDAAHAVAVHAVVDDEQRASLRHHRGQRGLHRGGAGAGEQHGADRPGATPSSRGSRSRHSRMTSKNSGSRWQRSGVSSAWRTRGLVLAGPGLSRTHSRISHRHPVEGDVEDVEVAQPDAGRRAPGVRRLTSRGTACSLSPPCERSGASRPERSWRAARGAEHDVARWRSRRGRRPGLAAARTGRTPLPGPAPPRRRARPPAAGRARRRRRRPGGTRSRRSRARRGGRRRGR